MTERTDTYTVRVCYIVQYTVLFQLSSSSVGSFHVGAYRFTSVFIYLVVLGLSCGMRDLCSLLWHVESSVAAYELLNCDMWDLMP